MSMSASSATVKQREQNTHKASGDREDVGGLIFKWARGRGVELKREKQEMREWKWACGGGVDMMQAGEENYTHTRTKRAAERCGQGGADITAATFHHGNQSACRALNNTSLPLTCCYLEEICVH